MIDADQAKWLEALRLPLPTARQKEYPDEWLPLLDAILQEHELDRHQLRFKYPRDTFFSKGTRNAWLRAGNFRYDFHSDELQEGCSKLVMEFELPKGAYATMIVKNLSQVVEVDEMGDNEEPPEKLEGET